MVKMNKAQAPLEILQDSSLKRRFLTGQASLEYFIIFAVIAGLTLLSVSTFLNRTRTSSQNLYSKAVGRILNSQALTLTPTPTPTPVPTPTPTPPPPGAQLLTLNTQNRLTFAAGETVYIVRLTGNTIGDLYLNIVGMNNDANLTYTFTFPDGTSFSGGATGTDLASSMDFRSRSIQYPNTNYTYIPNGDYILSINSIGNSSVVLYVGCK
jgi:hypothetical protein